MCVIYTSHIVYTNFYAAAAVRSDVSGTQKPDPNWGYFINPNLNPTQKNDIQKYLKTAM